MMSPLTIAIYWLRAAALALPIGTTSPASASEDWTCIQTIGNKPFTSGYKVDGGRLLHADGTFSSTILENKADHMISYLSFLSETTRFPVNSPQVRISEPFVTYMIIEKRSGRVTTLSNGTMVVVADQFGKLPEPDVGNGQCTPN
jgi:hypothetical protein